MDTPFDISVVVCVLNGRAVIGQQLDALAAQRTNLTWELIVADNGSTDGTVDYVESRAATFPVELRVVDASQHRGAGAARNTGLLASRSERVAFCDCDDYVAPGWLDAAYRGLDEFDAVAGLNRELREPLDMNAPIMNPGCVVKGSFGNAVMSGNAAFRRDVFIACGGFDVSLPPYGIEDFEMSIRLNRDAHARVGAAPDMLMYFRPTTDRRVLLRKVYMAGVGEVYAWHRHPDLYAALPRLPRLVRRVITVIPELALATVRGQRPTLQQAARQVVTRVANLRTEIELRTGRRDLAPPRLLS